MMVERKSYFLSGSQTFLRLASTIQSRNSASLPAATAGTLALFFDEGKEKPVGWDIFDRGLCLPSDNKMTEEQQDRIIEVIRACFE